MFGFNNHERKYVIKNMSSDMWMLVGTFNVTQVGRDEATKFARYDATASAIAGLPGSPEKYEVEPY